MDDGLHFTPEGHQLVFELVSKTIEENFPGMRKENADFDAPSWADIEKDTSKIYRLLHSRSRCFTLADISLICFSFQIVVPKQTKWEKEDNLWRYGFLHLESIAAVLVTKFRSSSKLENVDSQRIQMIV